ncbi:hypothetical protein NC651_029488 [Populus alba x Populus x berolinensis]|nr:hypothetical protein NC651_029488 [Populus alba x Populus x berolinensis]
MYGGLMVFGLRCLKVSLRVGPEGAVDEPIPRENAFCPVALATEVSPLTRLPEPSNDDNFLFIEGFSDNLSGKVSGHSHRNLSPKPPSFGIVGGFGNSKLYKDLSSWGLKWVLFAEPIVITACEFLEQNASSASQAVSLLGLVAIMHVGFCNSNLICQCYKLKSVVPFFVQNFHNAYRPPSATVDAILQRIRIHIMNMNYKGTCPSLIQDIWRLSLATSQQVAQPKVVSPTDPSTSSHVALQSSLVQATSPVQPFTSLPPTVPELEGPIDIEKCGSNQDSDILTKKILAMADAPPIATEPSSPPCLAEEQVLQPSMSHKLAQSLLSKPLCQGPLLEFIPEEVDGGSDHDSAWFRVSGLGFGVWGLGFGVWGLGFGVWGLGFGVWGLGFGVWGLGFGVWGLGFGVSGFGFRV